MNITIVINGIIPVTKYGGTERVMWSLGKALHDMGHSVTFLAAKGTGSCSFANIKIVDPTQHIEWQVPDNADVVHFNDMAPSAAFTKPYVVTFHGNRINTPIDINSIFVSRNHAERFGSKSFVYNGLNWDDYPVYDGTRKRAGYHFLGKGAWSVKNLRGCIKMTGDAHLPLEVLGASRLNFKMGFRFTLTPRVHFHNMVDNTEKARIISASKGLLFPVLWDVPFGLAIIESMYYGAPVYGTTFGSLPELVTPDTGLLTDNYDTMVQYLRQDCEFSPQICHQYAADMFNAHVMAERYLEKYTIVMDGHTLNDTPPHPIKPFDRYKMSHN